MNKTQQTAPAANSGHFWLTPYWVTLIREYASQRTGRALSVHAFIASGGSIDGPTAACKLFGEPYALPGGTSNPLTLLTHPEFRAWHLNGIRRKDLQFGSEYMAPVTPEALDKAFALTRLTARMMNLAGDRELTGKHMLDCLLGAVMPQPDFKALISLELALVSRPTVVKRSA